MREMEFAGTWDERRQMETKSEKQSPFRKAMDECRWLEMDIRSKTDQIQSLKEAAGRITQVISASGGSHPKRHDAMEKAVVSMVDLENEISREICRLTEVRRQMMACLDLLRPGSGRTVLQLRYLNRKSWQEIADAMDCSLHTVYRIHRETLRELEKVTEKAQEENRQFIDNG